MHVIHFVHQPVCVTQVNYDVINLAGIYKPNNIMTL